MNQVNHVYKNQTALNKAVTLWQKRLRLQDWTVSAALARATSFGDRGTLGCCSWNVQNSAAEILLLDVAEYEGDDCFTVAYDAEETLVHELLHVAWARVTAKVPDGGEDDYEIAINKTAEALVRAYRQ